MPTEDSKDWLAADDSSPEPVAVVATSSVADHVQGAPPKDVWETDEDICAYCAARVKEDNKRCPNCRRPLVKMAYRYRATSVLYFFWVLLLSLGLIAFFHAMFKYSIEQDSTTAVMLLVSAVALVLLTVGVYLRQIWAHLLSVIVLILLLILSLVTLFIPFDPSTMGLQEVDTAVRGIVGGFAGRLSLLAEIVQTAVTALTLFYAVFRAGPEFDRVAERQIARTKKGLHTSVDYHMTARRLAQEGKWASATLHWQRAAAIEPAKAVYHRDLAKAYFRLGFIERGLDVLSAALTRPMGPAMQSEMSRLEQWGRQQANRQAGAGRRQ